MSQEMFTSSMLYQVTLFKIDDLYLPSNGALKSVIEGFKKGFKERFYDLSLDGKMTEILQNNWEA